jgi:hypothetical protein
MIIFIESGVIYMLYFVRARPYYLELRQLTLCSVQLEIMISSFSNIALKENATPTLQFADTVNEYMSIPILVCTRLYPY